MIKVLFQTAEKPLTYSLSQKKDQNSTFQLQGNLAAINDQQSNGDYYKFDTL